MTTAQSTKSPAASSPFDLATTIAARELPFAPFFGHRSMVSLNSLQAYLLDAWQRGVLCRSARIR